ncbi:hypothetical protein Cgig2_009316 [Carnegiea gigantea]|uniref:Thioredoxin-like protein 4B n=1 Tax=Carnegiea gigantea TaxID=171969 RepID=A0A9Q1Q871_9CARY|nr:hypothetical protein Cgig2_009316 [Carnegiea gigantea]
MSYVLETVRKKREIDSIIRDTIDKVLVLRFGRASDSVCLQLDDILAKSAHDVSKFARIALVDIDSEDVQVTADHTKWIGAFYKKQDFIDVVEFVTHERTVFTESEDTKLQPELATPVRLVTPNILAIFRGAMKGKLIVNCPLPPERIPKFQLLYKDV